MNFKGAVVEVMPNNLERVLELCKEYNIHTHNIGTSTRDNQVLVKVGETVVLESTLITLRSIWESTSVSLERLQCESSCVYQEERGDSHTYLHTYIHTYIDSNLFSLINKYTCE